MENRLTVAQGGCPALGRRSVRGHPGVGAVRRDGGSKASEATSGPPVNPPSHGDPTNPAQPR